MKRFATLTATLFLLCLTIGTAFAQTKTAQSAMFDNTASGNFVIAGSSVYTYNKATAATYFTNVATSGPVVTCSGNATNCASSNQPAAPAAPAADENRLNSHIGPNSCNFYDGTALSLANGQTSYTQFVNNVPGLNTKGNWKFEWTYTIAFADGVGGPYAEKTAWDLQSSSTTNADVSVTGFFAGQSVQSKTNGTGGWSFKASHTMTDGSGPRLVGAQAQLLDSNAAVVCTLLIDTAVVPGQNFVYLGNAGRTGTTGQLFDNGVASNGTVNDIQNGVSVSLNGFKDDHAGNNNTGGDQAVITGTRDPITLLPATCSISAAGSYTLKVTGTLKGVSGVSSTGVSVNSNICISAGTCSVCN